MGFEKLFGIVYLAFVFAFEIVLAAYIVVLLDLEYRFGALAAGVVLGHAIAHTVMDFKDIIEA